MISNVTRRLRNPFVPGDDGVTLGCSVARTLPGVAVEVHSGKAVYSKDASEEEVRCPGVCFSSLLPSSLFRELVIPRSLNATCYCGPP